MYTKSQRVGIAILVVVTLTLSSLFFARTIHHERDNSYYTTAPKIAGAAAGIAAGDFNAAETSLDKCLWQAADGVRGQPGPDRSSGSISIAWQWLRTVPDDHEAVFALREPQPVHTTAVRNKVLFAGRRKPRSL